MQDKFQRLIKVVYRNSRRDRVPKEEGHPSEEIMACFVEGRLSSEETEQIKRHIIGCEACAEIYTIQLKLENKNELEAPEDLISKLKSFVPHENKESALEIFLRIRGNLFELLNTNGDVLVGQELIPAPVVRSRKIKDFKDDVILLKDFDNIRVEVKIDNKGLTAFSLTVSVKEKHTSQAIKGSRITLLKDGLELESYVADSGKVVFDYVLLGSYTVHIFNTQHRFASIILEVKT